MVIVTVVIVIVIVHSNSNAVSMIVTVIGAIWMYAGCPGVCDWGDAYGCVHRRVGMRHARAFAYANSCSRITSDGFRGLHTLVVTRAMHETQIRRALHVLRVMCDAVCLMICLRVV